MATTDAEPLLGSSGGFVVLSNFGAENLETACNHIVRLYDARLQLKFQRST
jgi:hypothetical protein